MFDIAGERTGCGSPEWLAAQLPARRNCPPVQKILDAGATIIGVSADDIGRLNSFSSSPEYCAGKFAVASDPAGQIAASYGLTMKDPEPGKKDLRGEPVTHGFIPRTTFVLNKKGEVVAVFSSETDHIAPDEHVRRSLAIVKAL